MNDIVTNDNEVDESNEGKGREMGLNFVKNIHSRNSRATDRRETLYERACAWRGGVGGDLEGMGGG